MQLKQTFAGVAISTLFAVPAFAQSAAAGTIERNVNQQQRIEQGLKSGQLTTGEAARLEGSQAHVEQMQSRALRDGVLTPQERHRLDRAQNIQSRGIYQEKHDAQTGNPNSVSSRRVQAEVRRDANQQQRIEQGVKSGALTNREVGKLERGQAHTNRMQARAGADGHVGPRENARIQHGENVQSGRIYRQKHDQQTRRK